MLKHGAVLGGTTTRNFAFDLPRSIPAQTAVAYGASFAWSEFIMFVVLIAILLLFAAVGVIYLLLKNMGEEGIEVAAPGSCKSGQCGVRCAPVTEARDDPMEEMFGDAGDIKRKEIA